MPRSVLIVEDSFHRLAHLADLLEDRFETVRIATSPSDAVEIAVGMRPDVVITPFPAVTARGDLLSALLKRDPRTSACRLVAYSDWSWANTRAKALQQGCEAFVATSAPVEDLLAAIDRILDLPAAPDATLREGAA